MVYSIHLYLTLKSKSINLHYKSPKEPNTENQRRGHIQSNGISPDSVYTHCVYTEQTIESISLHDVSTPANKTLHYVPKFN